MGARLFSGHHVSGPSMLQPASRVGVASQHQGGMLVYHPLVLVEALEQDQSRLPGTIPHVLDIAGENLADAGPSDV